MWAALIVICAAQVLYLFANIDPNVKEYVKAYETYRGTMDDSWRDNIMQKVSRELEGKDIWSLTIPESVLMIADNYCDFTEMLDEYVERQKTVLLAKNPSLDVSIVDHVYENLRNASEDNHLVFDLGAGAESMTHLDVLVWAFLLFLLLLCTDLFYGEKATGMDALQEVSKKGRSHLYLVKFAVCQISSAIVWLAAAGVMAVTMGFMSGFRGMDSVIQDFNYNACPYVWNAGAFMAIVLIVSFLAAQTLSAVNFILSGICKNRIQYFGVFCMLFLLPYLIVSQQMGFWCYFCLPSIMNGAWMFTFWNPVMIGNWLVPAWIIAFLELFVIWAGVLVCLRRFASPSGYTQLNWGCYDRNCRDSRWDKIEATINQQLKIG